MEKYSLQDVNGTSTKDENLNIAVVGAGLVSWERKNFAIYFGDARTCARHISQLKLDLKQIGQHQLNLGQYQLKFVSENRLRNSIICRSQVCAQNIA